jgi:hypothetical protein
LCPSKAIAREAHGISRLLSFPRSSFALSTSADGRAALFRRPSRVFPRDWEETLFFYYTTELAFVGVHTIEVTEGDDSRQQFWFQYLMLTRYVATPGNGLPPPDKKSN